MVILGINGTLDWVPEPKNWLHGSSVTLVIDGVFVCSLEQERFSRKKYDGNFPQKCIDNLLNKYNLKYEDVDIVSYVGGATLKNLEYRHTGYTQKFLKNIFKNSEIFIIDHHTAHMFGSFLSSNFDESNVITLDSGGDYYPCFPDMFGNSFNLNMGSFGRIHLNPFKVEKIRNEFNGFTVGNFVSTFSSHIMRRIINKKGDERNFNFVEEAPGKIMGLSSYGNYKNIKISTDRTYQIFQPSKYDIPQIVFYPFKKEIFTELDQYSVEDCASWMQHIFESSIIDFLSNIPKDFKSRNLCFSGGCGLNIILNSKILDLGLYDNVHVHPTPNDCGLSFGSAALISQEKENKFILPKNIGCVGLEYSDQEVLFELQKNEKKLIFTEKNYDEIYDEISENLKNNKLIAWHQGRSEYGPRALGNRSILVNPSFDNKKLLNEKVKFREHWRPYAAMVMEEHLDEWFSTKKKDSYYMNFNSIVKEEKRQYLKSVTHEDNSCRIQSVNLEINDKAYLLLKAFKQKTGIPVLLNTSFNTIPGEPIVESPKDAIKSFLYSNIDILVINNFIVTKK